ncbi:MAG TPA: phospholipase D-like domain-containing protein [Polyangia bacterium]|nr:phospholipase D-like domain-containing protein [Polyangia bacterium]
MSYVEDLGDLTAGNALRLLRDGAQAFPAWLDAIDAASTRVSMEMYIFDDDRIGRRFADALCCAARRGVSVRLLYDFIGCRHASPAFFANMRRAGVYTFAYHPYRLWRPRFWTLMRRNHRKTLVCDGQVAFAGGINVADEWLPETGDGRGWHDVAVEVRGPAVQVIEQTFLRTWNWRAKRRLRFKRSRVHRPSPAGDVVLAVIANGELVDRFSIRRAALHAIRASRERAYLVSPYFMPDIGFINGLARAVARGVDVRVLVPVASDIPLADLASRASFARLLKAGVRLFQHNPLTHSKALLVDREFVSIGSYNFDHRSLVYNLELVVNALDRECNEALASVLEVDMAAGTEIRWEDFRRRPLLERVLERLAYGLRHWL